MSLKNKINIMHLGSYVAGENSVYGIFSKAVEGDNFNLKVCFLKGKAEEGLDYLSLEEIGRGKKGKVKTLFLLIDLIKREKVDILHCHRYKPYLFGALAKVFIPRLKVIAHVHGLNRSRTLLRKINHFFIFKKTDKVVAVSKSVKDDILKTNFGLWPDKVLAISNGIDLSRLYEKEDKRIEARKELDIKDEEFLYGNIGRLVETKGHTYLLKAFKKVSDKYNNVRLILIGEGELKSSIVQEAKELGIEEKIILTGFRKDALRLLTAFDAFVFSSLREGLSLAMLESMGTKVPTIVTRVGGLPEVIDKVNCNGFIAEAQDVESLAGEMEKLLKMSKEELDNVGEAGFERVNKSFSLDSLNSSLSELYFSLMEDGKKENKLIEIKNNNLKGYVVRNNYSRQILSFMENINEYSGNDEYEEVLKSGTYTKVVRINGEKIDLPFNLLVKTFKRKGFLHSLVKNFGGRRSVKNFNFSNELIKNNISINKPFGHVMNRESKEDFFVTLFEEGENLAQLVIDNKITLNDNIAKKLSSFIADLHLKCFYHGDLKWSNILLAKDDSFLFLDIDQMGRCGDWDRNKTLKDLARFFRYGTELMAEEWVKDKFLPSYLKEMNLRDMHFDITVEEIEKIANEKPVRRRI